MGRHWGEGYIAAPADEKRRGGKGGRMFLPCLPFPSCIGQLRAEAGGAEERAVLRVCSVLWSRAGKAGTQGKARRTGTGTAGGHGRLPSPAPPPPPPYHPDLEPVVISGKQCVPKQTPHEAGASVHSLIAQAERRVEGLRGRGEALPTLDPSLDPR